MAKHALSSNRPAPGAPADRRTPENVRCSLKILASEATSTGVYDPTCNYLYTTIRRISQCGRDVKKLSFGIVDLKINLVDTIRIYTLLAD